MVPAFENSIIISMFLIKENVIAFDSSCIHHLLPLESDFKSFTVCCNVSNIKMLFCHNSRMQEGLIQFTTVTDSGFLRTLDSSIKRNTAVIKKLKQINEEQREGLMEELRNVNLSKFVSEAVTSICDAKLRTSDIQAAVQVAFKVTN